MPQREWHGDWPTATVTLDGPIRFRRCAPLVEDCRANTTRENNRSFHRYSRPAPERRKASSLWVGSMPSKRNPLLSRAFSPALRASEKSHACWWIRVATRNSSSSDPAASQTPPATIVSYRRPIRRTADQVRSGSAGCEDIVSRKDRRKGTAAPLLQPRQRSVSIQSYSRKKNHGSQRSPLQSKRKLVDSSPPRRTARTTVVGQMPARRLLHLPRVGLC